MFKVHDNDRDQERPHEPKPLGCCECPTCRRRIRQRIVLAFTARRRWLGLAELRAAALLCWVPPLLFVEVVRDMVDLGVLVRIAGDPAAEDSRVSYLLSSLSFAGREGGGE